MHGPRKLAWQRNGSLPVAILCMGLATACSNKQDRKKNSRCLQMSDVLCICHVFRTSQEAWLSTPAQRYEGTYDGGTPACHEINLVCGSLAPGTSTESIHSALSQFYIATADYDISDLRRCLCAGSGVPHNGGPYRAQHLGRRAPACAPVLTGASEVGCAVRHYP